MRIAWRTVGAIITRLCSDTEKLHDQFAGLRRIDIDEISDKRGHKYLTRGPVPRRHMGHRSPRRSAAYRMERRRKAARANDAKRGQGRSGKDAPARPDGARAGGVKNSRYALEEPPRT